MADCRITLARYEITGSDADGYPTGEDTSRREVFAEEMGVGRAEFYTAARSDYEVKAMFRVRAGAYRDENYLEYKNKRYYILRSYPSDREHVELSCTDKVVDNGNGKAGF